MPFCWFCHEADQIVGHDMVVDIVVGLYYGIQLLGNPDNHTFGTVKGHLPIPFSIFSLREKIKVILY